MKKSLLIASGVVLSFFAKGQSAFAVYENTSPFPVAQSHYVFNTDTTSNHNSPAEMIEFRIKNTSSSTKLIKIRKNILVNATGQSMYFCFNQSCYTSATYYSIASMNAGATLPNGSNSYGLRTEFDFYNYPISYIGTSIVRYTIYDSTNVTDSTNITITYNVTANNAIKNITEPVYESNAWPNPASNQVNFNYDLAGTTTNASIKLYNSLGTLVKTITLNPALKSVQTDVSGLDNGFYFYSIIANDKIIGTKRVVIAR